MLTLTTLATKTVRTTVGALAMAATLHGAAALAQPTADANPPVFEVTCLCQSGHDATRFSAEIAVTDANRDALRARIETGALTLRRHVVLRAASCAPRAWRTNDAGGCGSSTLQVTLPSGERQTTRADDIVVVGDRRIRITDTGNITTRSDAPEGTVALDAARWARVNVINISGRLVP